MADPLQDVTVRFEKLQLVTVRLEVTDRRGAESVTAASLEIETEVRSRWPAVA